VRYLRQDLVAEREARETSIESLRRELSEELRREVGAVRSDIDQQRQRIKVQEEEGFLNIDGMCISWGQADIEAGGAPAATDIDFPRKYRTPPAVFGSSKDHCSFVIGTGDNGHTRVRKDGFTASALSFAGVEATKKGCAMNWFAVGSRVVDADRGAAGGEGSSAGRIPRLDQMSQEDQEKMFRMMFRQADANGNGVLDQKEFMALLKSTNLGLSRTAIRRIMEEADVNNDGCIEYREFVPVMIDIIETSQAVVDAIVVKEEVELAAWDAAQVYILEGMSREQLEAAALGIFQAADMDNSGMLDRKEFIECLKALDLGMTRKEIQFAMAHVDTNNDGVVSYEEFLPLCFDIFVEIVKDKLLEQSSGGAEMEKHFLTLFEGADSTSCGKLSASKMREILGTAGMTPIQVETTMAEAQLGGDGSIIYGRFARICAQYGLAFFGAAPPATKDFSKMTDEELSSFLQQLFASADVDSSGALDEMEFINLLKASGLGLTRKAMHKIMEEADANDDGEVSYEEFVEVIIKILAEAKVTGETLDRLNEEEAKAEAMARELLLGDVDPAQLELQLDIMFNAADTDKNGYLSRNEFLSCMKQLQFGLTNKEIKSLMVDVDKDHDGKIQYEEFRPLATQILIEKIKEKLLEGSDKLAYLMQFFMESFGEVEIESTGLVSADDARMVLESVGMSNVLTENLLMLADIDGQGKINFKRFSRICAQAALDHQGDGSASALSMEKRRARAVALFRRIDADSSGRIDVGEMESYVKRLAAKFRTSHIDEASIAEAMEAFQSAPVTEDTFADYICQEFNSVGDEEFFAFLDYCDTPSYQARQRRLRTLFWKLDTDGSGFIDMDEKRQYAKKLATSLGQVVTDDQLNELVADFSFIDKNCDGKISEEEFITTLLELFELVPDENFMDALALFDVRSETDRTVIFQNMFRRHDLNKDGMLDAREVKIYFKNFAAKMGAPISEVELNFAVKQFSAVDANGDGDISMEEFVSYFLAETAGASDEEFYQHIEFFDA